VRSRRQEDYEVIAAVWWMKEYIAFYLYAYTKAVKAPKALGCVSDTMPFELYSCNLQKN